MNYSDLNQTEKEVLTAIADASRGNGGDFTYFDEVAVNGLSVSQLKGYVSQLVQKGYISISNDKFKQIYARGEAEYLTEYLD